MKVFFSCIAESFFNFVDFCNSNPALLLLAIVLLAFLAVFASHKAYGTPLSFKVLTEGITKQQLVAIVKSAIISFFMPWRMLKKP